MKYLLNYYWPLFRHQVLLALSWSLGQAAWSCCPCTLHYKVYVTGQLRLLRAHMGDWLNWIRRLHSEGESYYRLRDIHCCLGPGCHGVVSQLLQQCFAIRCHTPALCDSLSHCSILINIWACDICLSKSTQRIMGTHFSVYNLKTTWPMRQIWK